LAGLSLQLDFEDGIREAFNILWWELVEGPVDTDVHASPVVAGADASIPVVFADEGEFSVKGDTDTGIARELEGCTVVERADSCNGLMVSAVVQLVWSSEHTWSKLPPDSRVLALPCQRLGLLNLFFALLSFLPHLLKCLLNSIISSNELIDVFLLQGKSRLYGLLTSPVFPVGFTLDINSRGPHATIPSETESFGAFILAKTAKVELKIFVIVVDRGDGGVFFFELFIRVEDEHGQMLR